MKTGAVQELYLIDHNNRNEYQDIPHYKGELYAAKEIIERLDNAACV